MEIMKVYLVIGSAWAILDTVTAFIARLLKKGPLFMVHKRVRKGYYGLQDNLKRVVVTIFGWPYIQIKSLLFGIKLSKINFNLEDKD